MLEDSILADLDNIVEHASDEILKRIDEAVNRVIQNYRNETVNSQKSIDLQLLAVYPLESLKSFYKILEIRKHTVPETDISK